MKGKEPKMANHMQMEKWINFSLKFQRKKLNMKTRSELKTCDGIKPICKKDV